jgi:hypothetical protein
MTPLDLIPGISKLLDYFSAEMRREEDKRDSALMAILAAAVETKMYLESLESNAPRNRTEETELVKLWQKAAIPVRHIDLDLAASCLDKADDWIRPQTWDISHVEAKRKELQQICSRIRQLLRG